MMITKALLSLLKLFNIKASSIQEIKKATQKKWLRGNIERWMMEEIMPEKKQQAMPYLRQIGCVDPIFAKKKHYKYAAVHGGTLEKVQDRLGFLLKEWKRGVRFEKLVFLTGERYLDKEHELEIPQEISTETEMMLFVFQQMEKPPEWQDIPLLVIDCKAHANGTRPKTRDTLEKWQQKEIFIDGDILFISNQPFVHYQDAVAKNTLPKNLSFETIGEKSPSDTKLSLFLDNLARWIYEEMRNE